MEFADQEGCSPRAAELNLRAVLRALFRLPEPTTKGASAMRSNDGSVADGDDFEVFRVNCKCVVLVAVVVFGKRDELVAE
jgi:hypothetical protein